MDVVILDVSRFVFLLSAFKSYMGAGAVPTIVGVWSAMANALAFCSKRS
jgi:hypothetical protein